MSFVPIILIFTVLVVVPVCLVVAKARPVVRVASVAVMALALLPVMEFVFTQGIRHGKVTIWQDLSVPLREILYHFDTLADQGNREQIDSAVDRLIDNEWMTRPNYTGEPAFKELAQDIVGESYHERVVRGTVYERKDSQQEN